MGRVDGIVIPKDTPWLKDSKAQAVCRAIENGGFRVYFVGGCVRNALLGAKVSDIDLATNARPEQVIELAKGAGLKPVPTGIDHGTITVVVDGEGFEVTTFRRDVETDGRRAVVAFSDDIADDARRRDFTMNAIYATWDGAIVDPLGGLDDLHRRQLRFIEDADARIREDYLRTLRFFRFHAWYADPQQGFDPTALAAIAANLDGLETLSSERVGSEIKKLLSAADPAPALAGMAQTGVLHHILPGSDARWVGPLVHLEEQHGIAPDWVSRLVALGGDHLGARLRLSNADARVFDLMKQGALEDIPFVETAYRFGLRVARGAVLVRHALTETPVHPDTLRQIEIARAAVFPIKAVDLMPTYTGKPLGTRLAALENAWIASNFTLTKAQLLAFPT